MFRGNHPTKVDEKGRLKLPSAFKALVDAQSVTKFFVTSRDGRRAEIWPLPEWEKVEARLNSRSSALDDAAEEYMTLVNYYGQEVEMDNPGRVLLPQILRTKARLDGDVTVMGMRVFLAVDNRGELEKRLPSEGMSEERRRRVDAMLRTDQ